MPRRRARRLVLPLVFAVVALSGCGREVSGDPTAAAGFRPGEATGSARPTPPGTGGTQGGTQGGPQGSRAPAPKNVDGVDPCALLQPADLGAVGGARGEPRRGEPVPDGCFRLLAGGAADDSAAVGFFKPLDQVKAEQPGGRDFVTEGYPTWFRCKVDSGYQTCTAAVAVRPDRTLLTALSKRDTPVDTVRDALNALTVVALHRLPSA
ncbi:hypothetical protein [Streptoalloteichus hindustanus]|nr:hypothetical protein [Streptoalloteichus hindustanus]